jgi:hypothetical protein
VAEKRYPVESELDLDFEIDDGLEPVPQRGEWGFGALLKTLDTGNRAKNAATQDLLTLLPGTESPERYFGSDLGRTARRIWDEDLMGSDVIRETFPEVDVVENTPGGKWLNESGFRFPSISDAFAIGKDVASLMVPGLGDGKFENTREAFSKEASPEDGFFDKRRTLKDAEENAEFLTRNVAGFTWDVATDPLNLVTFGTGGFGKKVAQGLLKAGDALGPVVTKAASNTLTGAGAFKYAEKFNDLFARDIIKQVPHLSDKKALVKALQLSDEGLASVDDVAKGLGVHTSMKYGNPLAVTEELDSIIRAADGVGMRASEDILMDSTIAAQKGVQSEFVTALELTRKENATRLKQLASTLEKDPLGISARQDVIRRSLDLGEDVPVTALFEPNRLRYAGKNIPIVSDVFDTFLDTAQAAGTLTKKGLIAGKDAIAEAAGSYPMVERVGSVVNQVTAPFALKALSPVTKAIGSMLPRNTREALAPMSRRLQAMPSGQGVFGSGQGFRAIREGEANRAYIEANTALRAEKLFAGYDDAAADGAAMLQEGIESARKILTTKNPNITPEQLEVGLSGVKAKFKEQDPRAYELWAKTTDDFARYGKLEESEGILNTQINDYYARQYLMRPGAVDSRSALTSMAKREGTGVNEGFTKQRTFDTELDAAVAGFEAIRDPRTRWVARTTAHEMALANKKQTFDMVMQFGISPDLRQAVASMAKRDMQNGAREAARIASESGIQISPMTLLEAPDSRMTLQAADLVKDIMPQNQNAISNAFQSVDKVWGLPRLRGTNEPISPQLYQSYKQYNRLATLHPDVFTNPEVAQAAGLAPELLDSVRKGIGSADDFTANMKHNNFTFDPTEEAALGKLWDNYQSANEKLMLVGQKGKLLGDNAGMDQLPPQIKDNISRLYKGGKINKQTADMLGADLPDNMIAAIKESFETKNYWREFAKSANPQTAKILNSMMDAHGTFMGMLKVSTTRLFPSYWMGNLTGGQFQNLHAIEKVSEAIKPTNLLKNHEVFSGGADLVTRYGQRIPNKQILREMKQYGMQVTSRDLAESLNAYDKMFRAVGKHVNNEMAIVSDKGLIAELNTVVDSLENFGRNNLYIALRRQGVDPATAASDTNRAMVDYARGKTGLEKNIVAPLAFFYAFSRGETSNTFKSLVTQPGRLMPQYRYLMQSAEVLAGDVGRDETLIENSHYTDYSSAKFGKMPAVGIDRETGNPLALVTGRTPIEDIMQLLQISLPSEMSVDSFQKAATDSVMDSSSALMSRMNPLIKGAIEGITGKDIYTGRDTDDPSLAANKVADLDVLMEKFKGNFDYDEKPPVKFQENSLMRWAARNIPPFGRLNTEAQKGSKAQSGTEALLNLLGMRVQAIDPRTPTFKRDRELMDALKAAGLNPKAEFTKSPRQRIRERNASRQ